MQPKSSEKPRALEPGILDLLERIRKYAAWRYDDEDAARAYQDLYALLSEHGRL